MAIPFLNNINLSDNELQNAKLHVTSTAPTAATGQIYFDSSENVAKYHDGTGWISVPREISVGGTSLAHSQAINFAAGTNVGISEASGVITISSTDQYTGTVTSVGTSNSTFISATGSPITSSGSLTFSLSATGTPDATKFLRGDNTWALLSGIYSWDISGDTGSETVGNGNSVSFAGGTNVTTAYDAATNTLTINSTDQFQGTLTGVTQGAGITVTTHPTSPTVALDYLGADNYLLSAGANTVASPEDVINFSDDDDSSNVKKTTLADLPVEALTLVKTYIDDNISGGVVYQGGYDAASDSISPSGAYGLEVPPSPNVIKKGWMYTVTVAGTFFTEQVRIGDVIISEIDAPTTLNDWTLVQANADYASATAIGLGNVKPGSSNTVTAPYVNGSSTLDVVDSSATQKGAVIVEAGTGISVTYSAGTATVANTESNASNTASGVITAGSLTGTVNHTLGVNTIVQTISSTGETVFCEISRTATSVSAAISASQAADITILVQKIG